MQVMTDVECYGDTERKRIFQLSAVAFDLDGKINDPHELIQIEGFWFDAIVTWEISMLDDPGDKPPLPVNADTIEWWQSAEQAAGRAVLTTAAAERAEPLHAALSRFSRFTKDHLGKKGGHWANSPTYDLTIIRGLYEFCEMPVPWHYRQERDQRTLMWLVSKLGPAKLPKMDGTGLVPHVGLHDAARQAAMAQAAYRLLGITSGDYARAERSRAAAS